MKPRSVERAICRRRDGAPRRALPDVCSSPLCMCRASLYSLCASSDVKLVGFVFMREEVPEGEQGRILPGSNMDSAEARAAVSKTATTIFPAYSWKLRTGHASTRRPVIRSKISQSVALVSQNDSTLYLSRGFEIHYGSDK